MIEKDLLENGWEIIYNNSNGIGDEDFIFCSKNKINGLYLQIDYFKPYNNGYVSTAIKKTVDHYFGKHTHLFDLDEVENIVDLESFMLKNNMTCYIL